MTAPAYIGWAVETLVATTLLMLLVLAIRNPVRRAFGPHMAYALWIMPLVRMLMPPLPGEWQLSAFIEPLVRGATDAPGVAIGALNPQTLPPEVAAVAIPAHIDVAGLAADVALVPPVPAAGGPSLLLLVAALWGAGALAFLAYHLLAHRRYCARLLRAARADHTVAEGRVRVIETDAAHGPLAFGVFRKYVAFPRDFSERYDEQERVLALAHELGHHARGDLLANWVALLVLAIHWFNPVAWRAFRAFRADQEMACDALVLAGRAQALRHAYGRAIVKSAHGGAVSAACHLHTINEVKGRLRMLSKTQTRSPVRFAAGLAGVSAIGLAALGLTASGTQAAETLKDKVVEVTGVALPQAVPAAPASPAAPTAPAAPIAPAAPAAPAAPVTRKVIIVDRQTSEAADANGNRFRIVNGFSTQVDPSIADKDGKRVKKIVVVREDGSQVEHEMPNPAKLAAMIPIIENGRCGGGDKPVVEHKEEAGKRIMIICTDRTERMAANATRLAAFSLRNARREIEKSNSDMPADERLKTLSAIDQALSALEKQRD